MTSAATPDVLLSAVAIACALASLTLALYCARIAATEPHGTGHTIACACLWAIASGLYAAGGFTAPPNVRLIIGALIFGALATTTAVMRPRRKNR